MIAAGEDGRPGWNRTSNPQLRRLMLYPIELRAHTAGASGHNKRPRRIHYRKFRCAKGGDKSSPSCSLEHLLWFGALQRFRGTVG